MALKILLVEHDRTTLNSLKQWIQELSVEVLALTNSDIAAQRVQKEQFDGFLLEAKMPSPDGIELAQAIRKNSSSQDAPIVLLTDADDVEAMRRAFKAGITIFLNRPLSQERVATVVRVLRGPMLAQRRRHVRLPIRTPVECFVGNQRFSATGLNLGEGGMLIELPDRAQVGEEITLAFEIPGAPHQVQIRGLVLRFESPNRMAIRFTHASPEDMVRIREYFRETVKE